MNKGTLSFSFNGNYFGIAFEDEDLKKGPIFPAVSLFHDVSCSIGTSK